MQPPITLLEAVSLAMDCLLSLKSFELDKHDQSLTVLVMKRDPALALQRGERLRARVRDASRSGAAKTAPFLPQVLASLACCHE